MLKKADLHIHSNHSTDAFDSVEDILKKAKEVGLDVIALTDHDTIEGALEAQKIAQQFGLEVVIGEEIDTQQGEIIALFIKEKIAANQSLSQTIKEVKEQGGLVIACHPLSFWQEGIGERTLRQIASEIDGVEVLNSAWTGKRNFAKLRKINKEFLNLAEIAGSDAHFVQGVGRSYTVFEGQDSSDLYSAIQNKSTSVEGGFWKDKDYLNYVRYWVFNDIKRCGPLILFDLLWTARKIKKIFRIFRRS